MNSWKLKSSGIGLLHPPAIPMNPGLGLGINSLRLAGLPGTDGNNGSGAGGKSRDGSETDMLTGAMDAWELSPSPFVPPPRSAPILEILEVKLLSPPLVRAGCTYDIPAVAAETPSRPDGGSAAEAEGKRTLPFDRNGPDPPLKARYAATSLASLLAGRTGDGDVARNSIKSAASVSVGAGRGVVCCACEPLGGVCGRSPGSTTIVVDDDAAETEAGGFPVDIVRAEDWAKCDKE